MGLVGCGLLFYKEAKKTRKEKSGLKQLRQNVNILGVPGSMG